jgi:hypothetical protein
LYGLTRLVGNSNASTNLGNAALEIPENCKGSDCCTCTDSACDVSSVFFRVALFGDSSQFQLHGFEPLTNGLLGGGE